MYDESEEIESQLMTARAKKHALEPEKNTGGKINKVLIYFDRLYTMMNDAQRRQLIEALIAEAKIYEERQPNGQWLKSVKFGLPVIEQEMSLSLDNGEQAKPCVLLTRRDFELTPGSTL